jgi:hypothetical protein
MINTAPFGTDAVPSPFLTVETVTDPVDGTVSHPFHDLQDRAGKLQAFADAFCGPFLPPLPTPVPFPFPFPLPPISFQPILMAD